MPGRFINIPLFLGLPMLVGFLLRGRTTILSLLVVALAWAVVMYSLRFNPFPVRIGEREFSLMLTSLLFFGFAYFRRGRKSTAESGYGSANILLAVAMLLLMLAAPAYAVREIPVVRAKLAPISLPPEHGRVLTTIDNYLLQARSRVPTYTPLLDGFVHTGSGELITVEREMRDIYGVSLAQQPPVVKGLNRGVITTEDYAQLWAARSCEEWTRLASQYHLGLVITPPSLKLKLPRADNDPKWIMYYLRCAH
jgi:hypothetical protein